MKYDEVNYWSEIKLDIVKEYAGAYSTILHAQKKPSLYHVYIDAFAGAGVHISRTTSQFIQGSPLNALSIDPPFKEYHLIDLDKKKADSLRKITTQHKNVTIYGEDCNRVLIENIFPRVRYEDYRRGLCLLDPYGLHLNWEVISKAGQMKSIEIFLNFPVADMNRNVLWRDPEKVDSQQAIRLTAYWGDNSWREAAYENTRNLFGWEEKRGNEAIAESFRERFIKVAGFKYVPTPVPMRNSKGTIIYYLFFASQKPVAAHIVTGIFSKYQNKGVA